MKERDRTLESVTQQYIRDVRPAYFKHVKVIQETADIIIENNITEEHLFEETEKILTFIRDGSGLWTNLNIKDHKNNIDNNKYPPFLINVRKS